MLIGVTQALAIAAILCCILFPRLQGASVTALPGESLDIMAMGALLRRGGSQIAETPITFATVCGMTFQFPAVLESSLGMPVLLQSVIMTPACAAMGSVLF